MPKHPPHPWEPEHQHVIRVNAFCGAPACRACLYHPDAEECVCGYVDPGRRRHKTPWLILRADLGRRR